jgi:DMSO/TMAO reductase YedYZ molybdopterin-dependent catalytic subunit
MPVTRRNFLQSLGAGIVGVTFVPLLEGCESNTVTPLTTGTDFPFITPIPEHFVQNGAQASIKNWTMPIIDAGTWQLKIDGLVTTPKTYSFSEIQALASGNEMTILKTTQCVLDAPLMASATGFTGTAYWTGFPLTVLLDACGIDKSRTKRVRFYGSDGFRNNLLLGRIYTPASPDLLPPLICHLMNGTPLTLAHGFPVRLIMQEMFGFKCVKWITRIEATDIDDHFGTYQDEGFFDDGTVGVNAKTMNPLSNANVNSGVYQISGFAVAGAAALQKVELQVDGGAWQLADFVPMSEVSAAETIPATIKQLKDNLSFPYRGVWAKWRFQWTATPGSHSIAVRATDAAGDTQPVTDNDISNGTNGIMNITVTVS